MKEYARCEGDTGSPEVQVAVLKQDSGTSSVPDTSQRSSLQKRSSEDGWSEKRSAGIPEKNRHRKIPCTD